MVDKGYEFPLYTLTLMDCAPDDTAARYSLEVPEGRLCVPESWLRRAAHVSILPTIQCTDQALGLVESFAKELARAGIDAVWRESMHHWRDALTQTFQQHFLLELERGQADARWAELERETEDRWRRLGLWLRLAGIYLPGVPRTLPRNGEKRAAVLAQAAWAMDAPGWSPPRDPALAQAMPVLPDLLQERQQQHALRQTLAAAQGRALDRSLVQRAALMGDLTRCGEAARMVLSPRCAAIFFFNRLFPARASGRRPAPWLQPPIDAATGAVKGLGSAPAPADPTG